MSASAEPASFDERIASVLWQQWRAVGVWTSAGASTRPVDPEVLLVESVATGARIGDPRLIDAMVAWSITNHELVTTARLKTILSRRNDADQAAFATAAKQVADHVGRLSWPQADGADPWVPNAEVQLPGLAQGDAVLRLRMRAHFGANARAEAVAFLATRGDHGADLATIAGATSFSKRHIAMPLQQLVLDGTVETWMVGNRQQLRLARRSRDWFGYAADIAWIDWEQRFVLVRELGDAIAPLTEHRLVPVLGAVRQLGDRLQHHGVSVPPPFGAAEDVAARARELRDWSASANAQLLGA